jgi:hypothetical protein
MRASTAGGPWEGRKHPAGNGTGSSTTTTGQATQPCLSGLDCPAYNSIFRTLFFARLLQMIKAPLPGAVHAMKVQRGRQGERSQHCRTPGRLALGLEFLESELGRWRLGALDVSGGVVPLRGPDKGMEGFGP